VGQADCAQRRGADRVGTAILARDEEETDVLLALIWINDRDQREVIA
jgi:hypothetical protein